MTASHLQYMEVAVPELRLPELCCKGSELPFLFYFWVTFLRTYTFKWNKNFSVRNLGLDYWTLFFTVIWGLRIPKARPDRVLHCGAAWHSLLHCGDSHCCQKQTCSKLKPCLGCFFISISLDSVSVLLLYVQTVTRMCIFTAFQVEGSSETTEKVKKSLSSFLGVITDTLAPPPDKTIDCDVITLVATPAGTTEVYDSSKVSWNMDFRVTSYCDHFTEPLNDKCLNDQMTELSTVIVLWPGVMNKWMENVIG